LEECQKIQSQKKHRTKIQSNHLEISTWDLQTYGAEILISSI
jgi:hypothetical protein